MSYLYNKQRIKETDVEIKDFHEGFPNPSLLILSKYSDFDEKSNFSFWENVIKVSFSSSFINLLLLKKIKIVRYIDKTSIFFNFFQFKILGYNVQLIEEFETDDILTNDILSVLKLVQPNQKINLPLLIYLVIDKYIGNEKLIYPSKNFLVEYFNCISKKHNWIEVKLNNHPFGFISNNQIKIEPDKKSQLEKSYNEFKTIRYRLKKSNMLFRKFLTDLDMYVDDDFTARNKGD